MRKFQLDWRWVAIIIFIVLLANARSLPWPVTALALGGGGVYLLALAWQAWGVGGRGGRNGRVTYWRGQRVEMPRQPRRLKPTTLGAIAPVLIYALIGLALLLGAVVIAAGRLGL